MKKLVKLPLLAIFLLINYLAIAEGGKQKEERFGFFMKGKRQKFAQIPFESYANLIVVKLKIDNSDTLRFILDTGVSSIIITDPKIASQFSQSYIRRVKINGAGDGEPVMASVAIDHALQMGDIIATHQNIVVLDNDLLKLSEFMGVPIHGIFGHDIFSSFVVTINFETKTIDLTTPEKFKYHKFLGERFPIVVSDSKPYTEAIALVKDNKEIPIRLVIDTGAAHALLLNANDDENISLPDKVLRANLGRGLNGDLLGNIGRVKKIRLGHLEMNDILASFPDSLSFSTKFSHVPPKRQGSIGCELLRRFITTFNYQEGYIALHPIKNRIKESFEHDMSGLEIKVKGAKYNAFFIEKIEANSPAQRAGLKEGDELVFMNNQNIQDLNIGEIYKKLAQRDGKEISFFVRRNGDLLYTSFKLKRMI